MNVILNQGNWDELRTKLKTNYPQLTEADLQCTEGMEEGMLRMVEYKLQKTREEMQVIIAGYSKFSV